VYDENRYKSAASVIRALVDIVSKNGNLLLNIPVRGDGTIDEKEIVVLEGIAAWMNINKESIFDTRPWKLYGEGPAVDQSNPINSQGFNEGKIQYSAKDIRYNQKGNVLYATVMGKPTENILLKSLAKKEGIGKIKKIELLGSKEKISWKQEADSLVIIQPKSIPNDIAIVFKIAMK
jgi:alpha-L-fucosidase